jgi:hypothetical protein
MIGKTNWEQTKKDYTAWWRKESAKPLLAVSVAIEPDTPTHWTGWNLANKPDRVEECLGDFEHAYGNYRYPLHSFPMMTINLGPGIVTTYLGGQMNLETGTAWFSRNPPLGLDQDIELDTTSRWYRKTLEMTALAAQRYDRFVTGMTDLGGNLDILAALRGTQQLLMDLSDNPRRVLEWSSQITGAWLKAYWEFCNAILAHQTGVGGWMGLWAPQPWFPVQCDFAYMISPAMFEKFVAPDLQAVGRSLPYTIYHWEVPGQFPHLDCLLSMPEVTGIQWNPGPGLDPPHSPKWHPLFRKIQDKGKLLVINSFDIKHIDTFFANVDPKGVYLAYQTRDARELEKLAKYL